MEYRYNVCLLVSCTDHFFHVECVNNMIGDKMFIKCPICMKIYGKQTGTQPNGTMKASIMKGTKCAGFNCDSIIISYNFPNGNGYTGTSRNAYLPYNQDGLKNFRIIQGSF